MSMNCHAVLLYNFQNWKSTALRLSVPRGERRPRNEPDVGCWGQESDVFSALSHPRFHALCPYKSR